VVRNLHAPYARYARPGAQVALVCITEDRRSAELASQHVAAGLEKAGVGTQVRLWATDERWVEFNTGEAGNRTQETSTRIAAESVMAGTARPTATRASLAESLVGDREPLTALLPAVREAAQKSTPVAERNWALDRLEQFHADGNRLSDPDAARLLVAIESTETQDALWQDMSRDNAREHSALWTDLTRRTPDEVRTPADRLTIRQLGWQSTLVVALLGAETPVPISNLPIVGSFAGRVRRSRRGRRAAAVTRLRRGGSREVAAMLRGQADSLVQLQPPGTPHMSRGQRGARGGSCRCGPSEAFRTSIAPTLWSD